MNRITRMLTITGLSLFSGALLAGPAMAATSTEAGAGSTTTTTASTGWDRDRDRYFDTRRECNWAGRVGERLGKWDDYDCERVFWGPHRGDWKLDPEHDRWDNDHDWDDDHRGPWRGNR